MRKTIRLNNDWYYQPRFDKYMINNWDLKGYEKVNLPHGNIELPYNYFDEKDFQFVSCYQKIFQIDKLEEGQRIFVRFEGVMTMAEVFINGISVGKHFGGYTPFQFDISEHVNQEDRNIMTVMVDSRELPNIPPFGDRIDYLTYGGIYREVELRIYDSTYINNARIEAIDIFEEKKKLMIHLNTRSNIKIDTECTLELIIENRQGNKIYNEKVDVNISRGAKSFKILFEDIEGIALWDLENPNLYNINLKLKSSKSTDVFEDRIGFRNCEFKEDGFYLNRKKIQIIGINRHQSYPYVGYAMPKRVQEKDAEIIKKDLHFNLVRTSHYPQSKHFLNKCDEMGLLVFEEIPGWQHIGNDEWKDIAVENVNEMIERDWNHPSIVLWGVRINESNDDEPFYKRTNELSRRLDSSRQTGGVRYIENSQLLEDVYTMNDFVLDGGEVELRNQKQVTGLEYNVPYLVTEYNGHMFPTKRFDCEERQMEHVMRHIRVQDAAFKDKNISGAIAWCAFDYNTHNDFGAGDRICYHGIMDMFRIKKFAAYVYKSQVNPKIEPVLMPVTYWARGERSIGGILPLILLTNCDKVELSFGKLKTFELKRKPDVFGHLPYPPIIVDETIISLEDIGEWGMKWEDATLKGYLNNEIVIHKKLSKNPLPTHMEVIADELELSSKEKDATRFVIKIKDQYDQIIPFFDRPVEIEVSGPARVLGPKISALKGGCLGFWIETINESGEIKVTVKCDGFEPKILYLKVK